MASAAEAAAKFRAIRSKRLSRKTLAQAIRDLITPEEQARWLLSVSQGVDPDSTPEQRRQGFGQSVTMAERLRARQMLIEYAHGTAPQRVQIEAEIRATTQVGAGGDFSSFSDEELARFREMSRRALTSGARAIIDAEAREAAEDEGPIPEPAEVR